MKILIVSLWFWLSLLLSCAVESGQHPVSRSANATDDNCCPRYDDFDYSIEPHYFEVLVNQLDPIEQEGEQPQEDHTLRLSGHLERLEDGYIVRIYTNLSCYPRGNEEDSISLYRCRTSLKIESDAEEYGAAIDHHFEIRLIEQSTEGTEYTAQRAVHIYSDSSTADSELDLRAMLTASFRQWDDGLWKLRLKLEYTPEEDTLWQHAVRLPIRSCMGESISSAPLCTEQTSRAGNLQLCSSDRECSSDECKSVSFLSGGETTRFNVCIPSTTTAQGRVCDHKGITGWFASICAWNLQCQPPSTGSGYYTCQPAISPDWTGD